MSKLRNVSEEILVGAKFVEVGKSAKLTRGQFKASKNVNTTLNSTKTEYYVSTSPDELVGGYWMDVKPNVEEGQYLWTRTKYTYSDGKTTYTTPFYQLKTADVPETKIFEVVPQKSTFIRNDRTTTGINNLYFTLNIVGYDDDTALVLVEDSRGNKYVISDGTSTYDDEDPVTSGEYSFAIPYSNSPDSVTIVATHSEAGEVVQILTCDNQTGQPIYLGELSAIPTPSAFGFESFINGDYFSCVQTNQIDGITAGIPYEYNGTSWDAMTLATKEQKVKAFTCLGGMLNSNVTIPSSATLYAWIGSLVAQEASIASLFAKLIEVGNAIYGGDVDLNASVGSRAYGKGFIMDSNGVMEISSGFARDLNVRNTLDLYADNGTDAGAEILHPALTTVPESGAEDTVGVTVNTTAVAWDSDNLLSAVSGVTKNSINASSGTFGSKSLAYYVYADNLATQLQAQIVVDKTLYPYQDSFSIPRYVKGTLSINISGNASSASRTSTSGFHYGTITIKKNNVTVFSQTGGHYSYTASLTGNDTITVSDSVAQGSHNWIDPKVSYTIPALTLANYVASTGFWLEYSDGSMEQIISSDTYTDRLQMSSPVSFDSNNYLTHRDCSALINYTSYTEGGITYNLETNVPYTFKGTNLTINGASVSSGYFSRISNSSVRIQYGGNTITVSSGNYYNIYGTIAVQKTERGVETMGLYPRSSGYNLGRTDKYWLNAYITNPLSVSKRSEKHDIQPYERNALAILNNTEIVRFKLNIDPENTPHIGFIADDTDSDLSGENHDSFISNHVISVCVKAIQELSAEVEELKSRLSTK